MIKKYFKNIKSLPKNSGFTLVETLIAISIFTVSILGLMTFLTNGIKNTTYVKQKFIATYLAGEGIEYMRNIRDTFVVYDVASTQNGWDSFNTKLVNSGCTNSNGCYFDGQNVDYTSQNQPMKNINITLCSSVCPNMLYDSTNGKYNYSTGSSTGFVRKINITQVSADEVKVSSTVSWLQGSGSNSITFSESLFNWLE